VTLVVGAVIAVRWWTHPTLFEEGGPGGFSADPQPLERATLHVGIALPKLVAASEQITFNGARAHFAPGSSAATAEFSICRNRHLPGVVASGTSNTFKPEKFCSLVRPLKSEPR
jgi:hypothetical protein